MQRLRNSLTPTMVSSGFDYFMGDRVTHHLGGRVNAELILDVFAVGLGGFGADAKALRDILAGCATGEQAQHFAFAQGEPAAVLRTARTRIFKLGEDDPRN